MNVAMVTHNVVKGDGQGRVNYELARHLLARDAEVDLIADRVADDLLAAGASWQPVHPGFDQFILLKVWRFQRMADRLLRERAGRYDVVLACGVTCSRPHAVNAVHFVHGPWLRSPLHSSKVATGVRAAYQWLFTALNARWERQVFARAGTVVAVSQMVRRELLDVGVPPEKIKTIVNGVDLSEFKPGPADRCALGLPEGVVLGLFAGDIRSSIKNLDTVLRALPDAPGVHLAVAGTLEGSPYPAMARRLGVAGRVHFLGFRDDVAALMRAADLFVLPSRRDSCPLVLLEALASGLPVVTARTVGTAGLVEPESGFVLDRPDDTEALAEALRALVADAERRRAMGRAARAVAERHSWKKMAEQYLTLFENISRQQTPARQAA
jgi:glycosyltransferase involved in cell wall biosynthesis